MEKATFGAGCFWCVEAVFETQPGVISVESGYTGGSTKDPTYKEVCSGKTGHAEVVQVEFNPSEVSYEQLLDLFWKSHDPTQVNRQGADEGTQYRTAIFYHNERQKEAAEKSKAALEASGTYDQPIATQIERATEFYPAEDYHQDYYRNHPLAPYSWHIRGKLRKLGKEG